MATINTAFTKKYSVAFPFAQAGMAFAGEKPELAIAVSKAGGIGSIGVGFMSPADLRRTIQDVRAAGVETFNINFITCFGNDEQVRVAADERVPIVSFHWGHPPEEQIDLLQAAGCAIWVQIGSVADAETALSYGAEVIIAQSQEAGGHNYQGVGGHEQTGMGGMALIPVVVDAVNGRAQVLAAGGISDGRGVAAALTLGADAVWVGTRLVAAKEANVHPEHHRRLIEAEGTDTAFASIFGPENPLFNPMRLHKTRVVKEWNDRLAEVPTERSDLEVIGQTTFLGERHIKRKFDVILPTEDTSGDFEEMAWLMGQGVGLIKDIQPAYDIVTGMMDEAVAVLKRQTARLG